MPIRKQEPIWTPIWPTKPGYYWFYGTRSKYSKDKEIHFVKVRGAVNGYVYITDGIFLYKEEAIGVWQEASLPRLPN